MINFADSRDVGSRNTRLKFFSRTLHTWERIYRFFKYWLTIFEPRETLDFEKSRGKNRIFLIRDARRPFHVALLTLSRGWVRTLLNFRPTNAGCVDLHVSYGLSTVSSETWSRSAFEEFRLVSRFPLKTSVWRRNCDKQRCGIFSSYFWYGRQKPFGMPLDHLTSRILLGDVSRYDTSTTKILGGRV